MTDKITLSELRKKLRDINIDEKELRKYFQLDEYLSRAFSPFLKANPELVDLEGLEGDVALGFFNWASKKRRQMQYRKKIASGWDGIRIVSEGDSWFQYPILLDDVIDQIFNDYAIYSLGGAGDLLCDMIDEDEITKAIEEEEPQAFLISGGGNDLVGDGRLEKMLHPFSEERVPEDYPNQYFNNFLLETVDLYRGLFTRLLGRFPGLKIFFHGYDWAIPNNGKWLGEPMNRLFIRKKNLQRQIVRVIIDRYNEEMKRVAAEFSGDAFHVDCRGAVPNGAWDDELHPENKGFEAVAHRFRDRIESAIPRTERFRGVSIPLCPGRERAIRNVNDIDPQTYRGLVARRARKLIGGDIGLVEDENDRRKLEGEISRYFEKINLGADFLPARFLPDGAQKAGAVCRIKVPGGFGTGFLIASKNFIMTNNHVLPDRDTAESSLAEFGFEDGKEVSRISLNPERFFLTDEELDFSIVACDGSTLENISPIPLLRNPSTVTRGERVNIVQHPRGRQKEIAIHQNKVARIQDKILHYRTDTEPGSSGSPVFNNEWDLVALHHAGWADAGGTATNEGIRIAAIVARILRMQRNGTESSQELSEILHLVQDSSPLLGFFDVEGVAEDDSIEVEIPHFTGTPDFADIGFWNIEHFNANVTNQRVEKVADVIHNLSMDVMGLVEVERPALEQLKKALKNRGNAVDYQLLNVRGRQDLAVMYDQDTTTVKLATEIANRHRQKLMVTTSSGLLAFPRQPLFARCKVDGGVDFIMIVVHFKAFGDAQSRARRKLAASILADIIDDVRQNEQLPVVLGGDLNESLNTDVLSRLQDSPDLFALTADDAMAGAASFVGGQHHSLIDHIIVSRDIRPGSIAGDDAAIVRLDRSVRNFSRDISDHVPIVMRIVARSTPTDIPTISDWDGELRIPVPSGVETVSLKFDE